MDAFVKTRRNRKIPGTTREEQKDAAVEQHQAWGGSSSYGRLQSDSLKRLIHVIAVSLVALFLWRNLAMMVSVSDDAGRPQKVEMLPEAQGTGSTAPSTRLTAASTTPVALPTTTSIDIRVSPPDDFASLQGQLSSSSTAFRFPSVDERVRYYMGAWYDRRPFNVTAACQVATRYGRDTWQPNLLYQTLLVEEGLVKRPQTRWYMADVYDFLLSKLKMNTSSSSHSSPGMVLVRFGDLRDHFDLPIFVKTRPIAPVGQTVATNSNDTQEETDTSTSMTIILTHDDDDDDTDLLDPILAPLNMRRHFYGPIGRLKKGSPDRPWKEKTATLVWRGCATGLNHGDGSPGEDLSRVRLLVDLFERFVFGNHTTRTNNETTQTTTTSLFDIGFTVLIQVQRKHQHKYRYLIKDSLSNKEQLQHKYLLNLEGNDVSSGLKWMLLSNSVVFMPIPTCVSWAMEEWLRPWYHYIPLRDDLQDLVEKIQWCREHDAECEQISKHATRYMQNLWMSPQAKKDQNAILTQMMERYQSFYGKELLACR